jgi:Zn-finger protein
MAAIVEAARVGKKLASCNQLALVHPEDGGDTILRNVGSYKSHTVSFLRK